MQAGVQLILDTRPAGAAAAGGASKEEVVDKICEDLLARVSGASVTKILYSMTDARAHTKQQKIWMFTSASLNLV